MTPKAGQSPSRVQSVTQNTEKGLDPALPTSPVDESHVCLVGFLWYPGILVARRQCLGRLAHYQDGKQSHFKPETKPFLGGHFEVWQAHNLRPKLGDVVTEYQERANRGSQLGHRRGNSLRLSLPRLSQRGSRLCP